jgi:single-strand DNA-binding protein
MINMRHKNHVHLIGVLGKDPEQIEINNSVLTRFNLCTERNFKDKHGVWQNDVQWHSVATFRAFEGGLPSKGDTIELEGDISTRKWTDKRGIDRWSTEITNRGYHQFVNHGRIVKEKRQDHEIGRFSDRVEQEIIDDDIPF